MKKIIVSVVVMIMACIAANAQVAADNSSLEFRGGKFYQNGSVIAPSQLSSLLGQETYDREYIPARKTRTAGIACLSAGGAVTAAGAGLIIGSLGNDYATKGMVLMTGGIIIAGCGAAAAITGGVLLGVANKKLKNLHPASSGAGIALVF